MNFAKRNLVFLLIFSVFLALPLATKAQSAAEDNIFITKETVIDHNFWRIGDIISISGTMKQDVIVFGQTVVVDGVIEGDLIGVANSLKLNGEVKGNVRFIANEMKISGTVGKNLTVFANLLEVTGSVGWGITSYANLFSLNSHQVGDLKVYGNEADIRGNVGGDLSLNMSRAGKIVFKKDIEIKGNLKYSDIKSIDNLAAIKVFGQTKQMEPFEFWPWHEKRDYGYAFSRLTYYLSLVLIGFLLLWRFRPYIIRVGSAIRFSPLESFKWGVVYLILVPVIAILIAITVIGLPISIIAMILYGICLYVTKVFVGLAFGAWLLKKDLKKDKLIWPMLLGGLAMVILISAPYVGPIFNLIISIVGLGAVIEKSREVMKQIK